MQPRRSEPVPTSGRDGDPVRIGISTCLLGEPVRFDGGHKRDAYIVETLGRSVEWVPVCPEVEVGLGVPREALRLVGEPSSPRLLTAHSRVDHTGPMLAWARDKVERLRTLDLDGYLLKSKSPSCGLERVRVYTEAGMPSRSGPGLFARALLGALPLLSVEDEGRLNDPWLRESFIARVFTHRRWRQATRGRVRPEELVTFHARHKLLLMAHSEPHLRALGPLIAGAGTLPPAELLTRYAEGLFAGLRVKPTTRKHTNVLQHIAGHLRDHLDGRDRDELHGAIADYRQGVVPLIVPMTLLRHHVSRAELVYLQDQVYLDPHPKELGLLNHV
jgi:uncharacterized protein YbgA (DUF1722 family)/uncharacterized protein YbbK (DUF523 family)